MRFRVVSALLLSLVLIVSATVFRVSAQRDDSAGLVAVDKAVTPGSQAYEDAYMPESGVGTSTPKNLTTTDLVGRQLLTDYLALATNGQADEASINNLADKYIESIGNLQTAPSISLLDLRTVANTKANFQTYADTMMRVSKSSKAEVAGINTANLDEPGPGLYNAAQTLASAYSRAASELKAMSVPASLASTHVKLVNHYLLNAAAMESLAHTEEDSTLAFAGIASLSQSFGQEETILLEIVGILNANGI